jgi:hypothetical protein
MPLVVKTRRRLVSVSTTPVLIYGVCYHAQRFGQMQEWINTPRNFELPFVPVSAL